MTKIEDAITKANQVSVTTHISRIRDTVLKCIEGEGKNDEIFTARELNSKIEEKTTYGQIVYHLQILYDSGRIGKIKIGRKAFYGTIEAIKTTKSRIEELEAAKDNS
jgi:hypothetical protein